MRIIALSCTLAALLVAGLMDQEGTKKASQEAGKGKLKALTKTPAEPAAARPPAAENPLAPAAAAYAAAFNKNDAAAVANLWSAKGVFLDRATGERTEGRSALQADFASFFEQNPGARIAITLSNTRLIRPDVATAEGEATVMVPDQEPATSAFTAIYVKEGDQWLVDSIQESDVPTPASPRDALAELEWLVGRWVDQAEEGKVETTVRWGASETFLVRAFHAEMGDEVFQGTQVIGWDPIRKQIRSWNFYSDGSFAEGTWTNGGDEWTVKLTHTLADGRLATGTQVVTRLDNDTLTVRTIGREIDGEPAPNFDAVTVVRQPAADDSAAASASGQGGTP